MITLLLWICPFTWPLAIMRMRRKRDERLIRAMGGTVPARQPRSLGGMAWAALKARRNAGEAL